MTFTVELNGRLYDFHTLVQAAGFRAYWKLTCGITVVSDPLI